MYILVTVRLNQEFTLEALTLICFLCQSWRVFQDFGLKLIDQSEDPATAKYSLL